MSRVWGIVFLFLLAGCAAPEPAPEPSVPQRTLRGDAPSSTSRPWSPSVSVAPVRVSATPDPDPEPAPAPAPALPTRVPAPAPMPAPPLPPPPAQTQPGPLRLPEINGDTVIFPYDPMPKLPEVPKCIPLPTMPC